MPLSLDLRHLEMIRAIAETGRVTDAAERLGLTPSALSHRIREAERRLGVALFSRTHKRLRLTPAAEQLREVAETVLSELENAEANVLRMNRGMHHVVRLGMESYSTYHWLPFFLERLRGERDGIDLQVMADATRETARHLVNHHIDLAIMPGDRAPGGTVRIPLFEDEVMFVMPPSHALAAAGFIEPKDLEAERFITYTMVPEPDREFSLFMRPAGIYPHWTAPVELPEAIVELVAAGQGTSVLAHWAIAGALNNGRVAAARLSPRGLRVTWSAVLREEDAEGTTVRFVADSLAAWCREDDLGFHRLVDDQSGERTARKRGRSRG